MVSSQNTHIYPYRCLFIFAFLLTLASCDRLKKYCTLVSVNLCGIFYVCLSYFLPNQTKQSSRKPVIQNHAKTQKTGYSEPSKEAENRLFQTKQTGRKPAILNQAKRQKTGYSEPSKAAKNPVIQNQAKQQKTGYSEPRGFDISPNYMDCL